MTDSFAGGVFRVCLDSGYCAFPVGGDTYKGCTHDCLYCYERRHKNQHLRKSGNDVVPRDYRALFKSLYEDVDVRYFSIEKRIPVQLGVVSDPFPPQEKDYQVTENFLDLVVKAGLSCLITTKAPQRISARCADLIGESRSIVRCSFSTLDAEKAKTLEPGAASPGERLNALGELRSQGIHTGVRLEPFLFGESYDYATIAAVADGVTMVPLSYSVLWRKQIDPELWMALNGVDLPEHVDAEWLKAQELRYFGPYRSEGLPFYDNGFHWVYTDARLLRRLYLAEREKAHAAGLTWGICCVSSGIHNIDLNDAPYCCAYDPSWAYDDCSLICQWHENEWAGLRVPLANRLKNDYLFPRVLYANAFSSAPIVLAERSNFAIDPKAPTGSGDIEKTLGGM